MKTVKCGVVCATTGAKPGFALPKLDWRGFIFIRFPRLILWSLLMPVTTDNQFASGRKQFPVHKTHRKPSVNL